MQLSAWQYSAGMHSDFVTQDITLSSRLPNSRTRRKSSFFSRNDDNLKVNKVQCRRERELKVPQI
jgi:hypothetical protein